MLDHPKRAVKSVHDHHLIGYEVHCERREIRLYTENRDGFKIDRALVRFIGVEAYDFKFDCLRNIICDIEEIPVEGILSSNKAKIEQGHRHSGWPRFWRPSLDEVLDYLRKHEIRGFELTASYGMSGWILARDMEIIDDASER